MVDKKDIQKKSKNLNNNLKSKPKSKPKSKSKSKPKSKHKSKKCNQDGGNVVGAAINLVKESIGLGKQIFKTAGGIMRMPYDLQRAVPPPEKKAPAQAQPTQEKQMPNNDLNGTPNP